MLPIKELETFHSFSIFEARRKVHHFAQKWISCCSFRHKCGKTTHSFWLGVLEGDSRNDATKAFAEK